MSCSITSIRTANAAFAAKRVSNPVAVFVGGTSGIGEATMRAFTQSTISPTIYLIGRNAAAAASITTELKDLNPRATVTFLESDISLLSTAFATATKIKEQEKKVNLLFLSAGYLSFSGQSLTTEGLERKMVVNYYGRALFARVLLPLLKAGAEADPELGARVISVFSPGHEGPVLEDDLELIKPENFSLGQAAKQAAAFTSLGFEHLAAEHKDIGWIHAYPGVVMTGITRELPFWARALTPVFGPFSVKVEDCAQGFLRLATDEQFKTGFGLVDWRGIERDTRKVGVKVGGLVGMFGAKNWWREELPATVWGHTERVFERVLGQRL